MFSRLCRVRVMLSLRVRGREIWVSGCGTRASGLKRFQVYGNAGFGLIKAPALDLNVWCPRNMMPKNWF